MPVQPQELANQLQKDALLADYHVGIDVEEPTSVAILIPQGEGERVYKVQSRADIGMMPPFYYIESVKRPVERDFEEFAGRYNFHGRLIEAVVRSLYRAKKEELPNRAYNFVPADHAKARVEQAEKMLAISKKQLNNLGFMDEADDEDIERKIVVEKPQVKFGDVGGQYRAKTELGDIVAGLENPGEFYEEGAEPPSGVLLYGPSGTGKTLLARAVAGESDATFFSVGLASILHSLWGKTERYIQRIFDKAREQAPAIIFFDEIDAIARQRSSLNQAYSSIVNILLTNLDGLQERSKGVVVMGATNLLDLVDDALLRPGRFDMLIPVDLPNDEEREQILRIHQDQALRRTSRPASEIIDPDFDFQLFLNRTKGFSGADIAELQRRALVERVRSKRRGITPHPVNAQDLVNQIALYEQVRKDRASRDNKGTGFLASRDRQIP